MNLLQESVVVSMRLILQWVQNLLLNFYCLFLALIFQHHAILKKRIVLNIILRILRDFFFEGSLADTNPLDKSQVLSH